MKTLNELEKDFLSALQKFASGDDSQRTTLFISYNTLTGSLNEDPNSRDRKLVFLFSALIEQLDNTDGETAETLYNYAFGDFLEYFGEEPVVQAAIRDYLENRKLGKLPLYIALGRRLNAE